MTSSNENIFRVIGPLYGDLLVTGEFLSRRPVTQSSGVLFDQHLNRRLSKQSIRRWFETASRLLWRIVMKANFLLEWTPPEWGGGWGVGGWGWGWGVWGCVGGGGGGGGGGVALVVVCVCVCVGGGYLINQTCFVIYPSSPSTFLCSVTFRLHCNGTQNT